MNVSQVLREARVRARLSQRDLAARTGVAQPTIARIESGHTDPRVATLVTLLCECGEHLHSQRRPGFGIDRSQIREMLRLTPRQRLELLAADAVGVDRLMASRS